MEAGGSGTFTSLVQLVCVMRSVQASQIIAEQTQLFKITVSFGSVSSSISLPCYMSHASIPAEVRAARGLPDHLVRISVGMEHPQDLLAGDIQCVPVCLTLVKLQPWRQECSVLVVCASIACLVVFAMLAWHLTAFQNARQNVCTCCVCCASSG